jgi:hypothetical protein
VVPAQDLIDFQPLNIDPTAPNTYPQPQTQRGLLQAATTALEIGSGVLTLRARFTITTAATLFGPSPNIRVVTPPLDPPVRAVSTATSLINNAQASNSPSDHDNSPDDLSERAQGDPPRSRARGLTDSTVANASGSQGRIDSNAQIPTVDGNAYPGIM